MEQKKPTRKRAKSFKVWLPMNRLQTLLNAVTEHLLRNNNVASFRTQDPLDVLRKRLMPAYEVLQEAIQLYVSHPVDKEDLDCLTLELHASSGYVLVSVREHSSKQSYKISFLPKDGKTFYNRGLSSPVRDASLSKAEAAAKFIL